MPNGDGKQSKALRTIVILLAVALVATGGWVGFKFGQKKYRERQARIAHEKHVAELDAQVAPDLDRADAALKDENFAEALGIVEQVLTVHPESVRGAALKNEITQANALAKAAIAKAVAEQKWERTRQLKAEFGFEEGVKAVEPIVGHAGKLLEAKKYDLARTKYEEVVLECDKLLERDMQRQAAEAKRDGCDGAMRAAQEAKAMEEAQDIWAAAQKSADEAAGAFQKHDFTGAKLSWETASNLYANATVWANGVRRERATEEVFGKAVSAVKAGLLDKFGGEPWANVGTMVEAAKNLAKEGKWAESAAKWQTVFAGLKEAVDFALVEEEKDYQRRENEAANGEFRLAMKDVGQQLTIAGKMSKHDKSGFGIVQTGFAAIAQCRASPRFGRLSKAQHNELSAAHRALELELFNFRYPDLLRIEKAAEISMDGLMPGSKEASELQALTCAQMDLPVEIQTRKTGIALHLIPAGKFVMGSQESEHGIEKDEPAHQVAIAKPFYIGVLEVTQGQWARAGMGKPSLFPQVGENAPVESVTWDEAEEFCRKLCKLEGVPAGTYRLPSEAEWEYACRAGTASRFYTGEGPESIMRAAWHDENSGRTTHPAGQKQPNAWGLCDTLGNVWEWCVDGPRDYVAGEEVKDPVGPRDHRNAVIRGGAWADPAERCRAANRGWLARSGVKSFTTGLRVIRTVDPRIP